MAKQTILRGTNPNDGTGDNLRAGGGKINDNFDEIYSAIGDGSTLSANIKIQDQTSTELTLNAKGDVFRIFGGSGIDATLSGNDLQIAVDNTVLTASQTSTLTNKTIDLGSNTITGTTAEFNTALSDGSFATLAGTEILTNKTIDGSSNTISNIGNSALTNSAITIVDDSSSAATINLGETLSLTGGSGIDTAITADEVSISVSGLTNANLSGSAGITNANLANSSVTLGADSISLGATQTTITDLDLDGSSSISGTGTIDTTGSANKLRFNHAYANVSAIETAIPAATYSGMYLYNTTTSKAYVADPGGWSEIVTENSSLGLLSNVDLTSSPPTDGEVLIFNSGNGLFEPGPTVSQGFAIAMSVAL